MLRREQSRLPGKRKETMLNRNMRNTAILLVVFLAVYMFGNYFAEKNLMSGSGSSSYSYERLESDIAKNKVKSIEVVQNAQVPTGSAIVILQPDQNGYSEIPGPAFLRGSFRNSSSFFRRRHRRKHGLSYQT